MQRHLLAALAAAAALMTAVPSLLQAQGRPWGENYFPNLSVVTHEGKTVRFYDDLIKGKMVIVSFIYTSCPDICPLSTARMAQVEEKLGNRVGRDIFIVSMTVDPENDTPDRLKEYAKAFGSGPGWSFVTGKPEDVRAINYKLGERSKNLSDHRNEIVLGNDKTGEWARDSIFGDIDRLILAILAMDPKWREEVRVVPHNPASNTGYQLGTQPGQAMFKKICAPCHTIGVGDRVGPDLRGVTQRRDRDWLAKFIQNPARLRAARDPAALALAEKYRAVRMPALGIAQNDASDLIAYLDAEASRLSAMQDSSASAEQNKAPSHHDHHH